MAKNATNPILFKALYKTRFLLLCTCLLVYSSGYSQSATLKNIQQHRSAGQNYLQKEKYDSAYIAIGKVVGNDVFSNPYDYLNFSLCNYKLKDTSGFLTYLNKAIEGGVDSTKVKSFLRKMTGSDKVFLDNYLNASYESLRKTGWAKYDTVLIKETNSIEQLDQLVRKEFMHLTAMKADSNYNYLMFLQKQADSINYVRVASLLKSGKFPGYRNCGAFASLTFTLIHLGDYGEAEWDYLFNSLKTEVLTGNVLPQEVATIADNHYQRGKGKLCSYYGQWTGRTIELCDCNNIDKYRDAIGLGNLQTDYRSKEKVLPECYKAIPSLPKK